MMGFHKSPKLYTGVKFIKELVVTDGRTVCIPFLPTISLFLTTFPPCVSMQNMYNDSYNKTNQMH